ncbi:MAG: hypothetical protein KBC42_01280 [Candidatus Pacebacteria bacterium]|nr:hypothetical protein [Candidatus Paceibacterota bacterium]MBP9780538.1 hypothetical protein [Candidatus Paceibacterota bacterium]
MTRTKIMVVCLYLCISPSLHAQMWHELIDLQSKSYDDTIACGMRISLSNSVSKIEGRDFTAEANKKVTTLSPTLGFEFGYDMRFNSKKPVHYFVGVDGRFSFDHLTSRMKIGATYRTFAFGLLGSKHIVRDDKGDISTRRGSFREELSYGFFIEKHTLNSSMMFYGEHSKYALHHFAEISKRLSMYEKFWIAIGSESMRGYGPRIYYKMTHTPVWIYSALFVSPPVYRDHENVSNSIEFGVRRMFY